MTQSGHGADISAMKQTKGVREDSGIAEFPRTLRRQAELRNEHLAFGLGAQQQGDNEH